METSIVTNHWSGKTYARPLMAQAFMLKAWGVALAFMVVLLALFAPRTAEARPGYLDAVILLNYSTSAQANICGNCHTGWTGNSKAFASRIDFFIYNGLTSSAIPAISPTYAMDSDNDGRTNLEEIQASQLAGTTRPAQGAGAAANVTNNWNWQLPDVDGDGCSSYYSRFTEAGVSANIEEPTANPAAAAIVGTGSNYRRFNPRGWDIDDNDAAQGCSTPNWTNATIITAPGSTLDSTPPGKVNTLSGAALGSAVIPLKWVPVGDDGNGQTGVPGAVGGKAHSYEIRYTTAVNGFATGVAGRNPRSPADWEIMHNILEPDEIDSGGLWSSPADPDSLMQALYEPLPEVPPTNGTTIQTCNARNTTCTVGASYDIKARGTNLVVNAITNLTTYWVAMWTHDGVTGVTGNLTTPGTVTEQSTLSNIIAVTPGGAGAAISSISPASPATFSGTGVVTVNGFGLANLSTNALGLAYQMVLTNSAGTAVSIATGLTYPATNANGNLTGTFTSVPAGTYNLELRTSAGVMKAAWVEAITVAGAPSTLTSVTPNTRGQNATSQSLALVGTGFATPMTIAFSDANITGTIANASVTSTTATAIVETVGATAAPGTVSVTANGVLATGTPAFTVTAAPTFSCAPALPLPSTGTVGVAYGPVVCTAVGGSPLPPAALSYTWTATGFPAGITAVVSGTSNNTLTISGTPTTASATPTLGSIKVEDNNAGVSASVAHSITISASTPIIYAVTGTAGANGSITPATQNVNSGASATFTITPNAGFVTVTPVGGTCAAGTLAGLTYTTGTVTAACNVSATFTPIIYAVTGTAGAGGTITPATQNVNHGSTATFTFTPNAGFATVTPVGGTCAAGTLAGTTYTTGTVTAACNVSATFTPIIYVVTGTAGANGSITPATQNVNSGASATFTITPNAGFAIVTPVGGTCAAGTLSGTTYTTGAVSMACNVAATFAPIGFTVTGTAGPNGSITPATQNVTSGGNATFTITPNAGFATVTPVGGTCAAGTLSGTTYTTGVVSANCTVSATFTPIIYVVTGTAGANGSITPATQNVNSGASATFTITPKAGFVTVTPVGGTCAAGTLSGTTYTTGAVSMACNVAATFAPVTYTVTSTATNGMITSTNPIDVIAGMTTTVTGTANAGYYFASVSGCGGTAQSNTSTAITTFSYITGPVMAACSVSATFSPIVVGQTLIITANPLGRYDPPFDGPLTVTLSSNLPSTTIYYTMNGIAPTTSSPLSCTAPCTLTITRSTLLQYLGTAPGASNVYGIQIYPIKAIDLVMTQVAKTATTVKRGMTFVVTNTARNKGALGTTTTFKTSFYLSADKIITTADIKLTGDRVIVGLAAKAYTTSAGTTVTVPVGTPEGVYYVGACADSGNVVVESSEGNNCRNAGSSSITGSSTITVTR